MAPEVQIASNLDQGSINSGILKSLVKSINTLASSPDFRAISSICDEITHLRQQLQEKDESLIKKETAISEMFAANERERAEQRQTDSRVESLMKMVQKKDDALLKESEETKKLQVQIKEAKSTAVDEAKNLARYREDINALRKELKDREKSIDKMKEDNSNLKETLSATTKRNKELESEKRSLSKTLEDTQKRLQTLEGFTVKRPGVEERQMIDSFANLWAHAATEVYSHLVKDFKEEVLRDNELWVKFRKETDLERRHHVPLPASNSPSAKIMRLAVILGILSREIDKHIFRPTYILSEDENAQLRHILNHLADSEHEREYLCRSMLLSIDSDTKKTLQLKTQLIVRTVSLYLYDFLSETQYGGLRTSLEKVVKEAIDIWFPIQRSEKRYEPDFEPHQWADDEWEPFNVPGQDSSEYQSVRGVPEDVLLTVFPRISLVRDGERAPLTYVVQLRKAQKLCVRAQEEMNQIPASPTAGRRASNRSRRRSTAQANSHPNGAVLKKAP